MNRKMQSLGVIDLVKGFRSTGTSMLSDLLDQMGLKRIISGLKPVKDGMALVGPAVTVKEISGCFGTYESNDLSVGNLIDNAKPGDVLIFDNGGKEISTWGGLASLAAKIKGLEGIVIDGGCRDADQIAEIGLPVFSRHVTPKTGKTRVKILQVNCSIQCSGVRVCPNDIVVADRTGIIVVPKEKADEILRKAKLAEKKEVLFVKELKKGRTFSEIAKQTGVL